MNASPSPMPSNLHDFGALHRREYRDLVARLRQAREELAHGPYVLSLVNQLALVSEEILGYREACDDEETGTSCGPDAERFLNRLSVWADLIRAENGEFDEDFLAFLDTLPRIAARWAA